MLVACIWLAFPLPLRMGTTGEEEEQPLQEERQPQEERQLQEEVQQQKELAPQHWVPQVPQEIQARHRQSLRQSPSSLLFLCICVLHNGLLGDSLDPQLGSCDGRAC